MPFSLLSPTENNEEKLIFGKMWISNMLRKEFNYGRHQENLYVSEYVPFFTQSFSSEILDCNLKGKARVMSTLW